jgi:hypothetical protein
MHSVVLPNGRDHVVLDIGCRKSSNNVLLSFYMFLWLEEWEYLTVLMAALVIWGW